MTRLHFAMRGCDSFPPLLPQRARVGHGVGLVDHDDLAPGDAECVLDDPGDTAIRVEVFLNGDLIAGALLESPAHAHVEALRVLAHDQKVDLPSILAAEG